MTLQQQVGADGGWVGSLAHQQASRARRSCQPPRQKQASRGATHAQPPCLPVRAKTGAPCAGRLAPHLRHRPIHEGSEAEVGGRPAGPTVPLRHHLVGGVPHLQAVCAEGSMKGGGTHTCQVCCSPLQLTHDRTGTRAPPLRTLHIWSNKCGWRSQAARKATRLLMVAGRGGSSRALRPPNSSANTCACGRLRPAGGRGGWRGRGCWQARGRSGQGRQAVSELQLPVHVCLAARTASCKAPCTQQDRSTRAPSMLRASLAAAYFCCCLRASLAVRAGPRTCAGRLAGVGVYVQQPSRCCRGVVGARAASARLPACRHLLPPPARPCSGGSVPTPTSTHLERQVRIQHFERRPHHRHVCRRLKPARRRQHVVPKLGGQQGQQAALQRWGEEGSTVREVGGGRAFDAAAGGGTVNSDACNEVCHCRHPPWPLHPSTCMSSGMNMRSRCLTSVDGIGTLLPFSLVCRCCTSN